jgi:diguanylate cyclase (GGDEF)-like protein
MVGVITVFGYKHNSACIIVLLLLLALIIGLTSYLSYINSKLKHSTNSLTAIHKLSMSFSRKHEHRELLEDILKATKNIVSWDFGAVLMVDGDAGLETSVAQNLMGTWHKDIKLRPNRSIIESVLKNQCGIVKNLSCSDEDAEIDGVPEELRSMLLCPMMSQDKTIGYIFLGSKTFSHFKKRHLRLLDILAGYAAVSIYNASILCETRQMAITDGLTNLYNYRYIYTKLQQEMDAAADGTQVSLILFDIDHFKRINDTYGHITGDAVLIETAKILRRNVRDVDTVGRYGGEEFAIILPEADSEMAFCVADRIRKAVEEYEFYLSEHNEIVRITISGGIASFPKDAQTPVDLVNKADKAMMRGAKREGRNMVKVYTPRLME